MKLKETSERLFHVRIVSTTVPARPTVWDRACHPYLGDDCFRVGAAFLPKSEPVAARAEMIAWLLRVGSEYRSCGPRTDRRRRPP